ncbi:EsaB/YukD family protein, partial [Streptomyces tauricus]|uniref:EsaB/YukD family protein n=1 Tax=Streptomyces tauricus TaxID=68274 RepID=UPI0033BC6D0E
MTDSAVAELCRLTVRAPSVSVDLAVPADVPVADLLPTLLRYVGEEAEEAGLDHAGWVLQQLGDAPLDEETTLAHAGLSDGAVLYLRPHTEALPEARLDDLVHSPLATSRLTRRSGRGSSSVAGKFTPSGADC